MKEIQAGYQNEFNFVLAFNNKQIKNLDPLLREVIDDLYPGINEYCVVKSWRNHINNEKADIFVKVDGYIRTISIKMGSRNSVHVESLTSFIDLLNKNNINKSVINDYCLYHYGINKDKRRLTSKEYCELNEDKIKKINNEFKKIDSKIIAERFLLNGNNSEYQIDGIIYGTPNDFLWINKHDIIKIIERTWNKTSNSVHLGCLFIQPLNRCINENKKYLWMRDYIQIKWYSLFDDILDFKNNKNNYAI